MSNKEIQSKNKQASNPFKEALNGRKLTIPNILCLIRVLLIPVFIVFFLRKNYGIACLIIVLSGLTDCFDGLIARKFNQESELGKLIDPLADKLTLFAVGFCLCFVEPYLIPVISILILKDVLMLFGSSKFIKLGIQVPKAKWYGKIGTILFYFTVAFIVFLEVIHTTEDPAIYIDQTTGGIISIVLLVLTTAMMIYAFIMYYLNYLKEVAKAEKLLQENINND